MQIEVNLDPLIGSNPVQQSQGPTQAMTEAPLASGLRLFQLWFTKPFSQKISMEQVRLFRC